MERLRVKATFDIIVDVEYTLEGDTENLESLVHEKAREIREAINVEIQGHESWKMMRIGYLIDSIEPDEEE